MSVALGLWAWIQILGAHCSASLCEFLSSGCSERLSLWRTKAESNQERHLILTSGLYTHAQDPKHVHSHTHMNTQSPHTVLKKKMYLWWLADTMRKYVETHIRASYESIRKTILMQHIGDEKRIWISCKFRSAQWILEIPVSLVLLSSAVNDQIWKHWREMEPPSNINIKWPNFLEYSI